MPPNPRELLRGAFSGAAAVGITGALSSVVSALSFVDERAPDRAIYLWATSVLRTSGVRTECRGLENLPPGNFVLCANHQSNFDPLVLFRHIRRHMRYVAKAQLLKVPLLGPALRRAGNIFVDRTGGSGDRTKLMEEQALRRSLGRPVFELDERFLEALPHMPPSAGIAVGIDRVLMLLLGASEIADVLLFPAKDFV